MFLPESSQVSVANEEALRASGLGIENMDADELTEMLEGDAEEVDFLSRRSDGNYGMARPGEDDFYFPRNSFELVDEVELIPSQAGHTDNRSKV